MDIAINGCCDFGISLLREDRYATQPRSILTVKREASELHLAQNGCSVTD